MGISLEITCVKKSNSKKAEERILAVGGFFPDGKYFHFTSEETIEHIEKNTYDFLVKNNGRIMLVYVAYSMHGKKYLKTESDWEIPLSLLKLPECP
jgi:hypothetical protein